MQQETRQPGQGSGKLNTNMAHMCSKAPMSERGGVGERHQTCPVRQHHIRCLSKLKPMPFELLNRIEYFVSSSGVHQARRRCPTMEAIAASEGVRGDGRGALRDLPLYTCESSGVTL